MFAFLKIRRGKSSTLITHVRFYSCFDLGLQAVMPSSVPRQTIYLVIILASLSSLALAWADSTCYYPNGTAAIDDTWPYTPCIANTRHSMCCRTTSTDTCRDDGLCDSTWDGNVWRDFCTDPTWQAPNCVKLCLKTQGTDGDGKASKTGISLRKIMD